MKKKEDTKSLYISEMGVWLNQQKLRLKSCEMSKSECLKRIKLERELIILENAQARIIRKIIKQGEKEFREYLKEQKDSITKK